LEGGEKGVILSRIISREGEAAHSREWIFWNAPPNGVGKRRIN
jgi:hypothetical protein